MQKGFIQPQRDDPISGIEIVVVVKAPSSGWRQREREPAGLLPSVSLLHSRTFFGKLFFSITCGMWKNRLHDGNKELAVTPPHFYKGWWLPFIQGSWFFPPGNESMNPLTHSQLSGFQQGLWSTMSRWEYSSHCPTSCQIHSIHFEHLPRVVG